MKKRKKKVKTGVKKDRNKINKLQKVDKRKINLHVKNISNANNLNILNNKHSSNKSKKKSQSNDKSTGVVNKRVFTEEERNEINSRTVFIGNLPTSVTRKKLIKLFSKYGPVESARIRCSALNFSHVPRSIAVYKKDFHPKATSVIGYVKFVKRDAVDEAMEANGLVYEDHNLRVDRVGVDPAESTKHSVFLGNLPFDVADNDVIKHFSECGEIDNVHVIRDNKTGIGKGFGYVNFKNSESIELALKLSGTLINKRNVRVKRAVKKFGEKRKNENSNVKEEFSSSFSRKDNIETSPLNLKKLEENETTSGATKKHKKKKKHKGGDSLRKKSFQGHTVKGKVEKKKKSKKKLKMESSHKKLIEILNKS